MSVTKLTLVHIAGDRDNLDDVISYCLKDEKFHPELPSQSEEMSTAFVPLAEENPYSALLASFLEIGTLAGYPPHQADTIKKNTLSTQKSIQAYQSIYDAFTNDYGILRGQQDHFKNEIAQCEGALHYLKHLSNLDVNFDKLFSCTHFKMRFGRLSVDSEKKLGFYQNEPFIYLPFDRETEFIWCVYFTQNSLSPQIDSLFASLGFEYMRVPEIIHETPDKAAKNLEAMIADAKSQLEATHDKIEALFWQYQEPFEDAYAHLKLLNDIFDLHKYSIGLKRSYLNAFVMTGFVEAAHTDTFKKNIEQIGLTALELDRSNTGQSLSPPTKLQNGWFSKPFELFVEMYGLPKYSGFDPTAFLAFTYCLLFGIMFGDLGQGLVVSALGWLLWKTKQMTLGRIMIRLGVFSSIFGLFYGSVFGFEHALDPFYQSVLGFSEKPIDVLAPENTNTVLFSAVALGIILICISIVVNICSTIREKDYENALFSSNGVFGLLFYIAVIFAGVLSVSTGDNLFSPLYIGLLLVLPLLAILMKEPLGAFIKGHSLRNARPHEGYGNYLLVGIFELIEVLISFFSNSVSFLRVGGFVLSHAGMMSVVFILSEMFHSASVVVIIIGNLFVMALEGLIVGIQVLRLEFYEMFSRYYSAGGRPFVSAKSQLKKEDG